MRNTDEAEEASEEGRAEARQYQPLDPVKRRSSVQSTHRTALLWPSATCTHCKVDERLLLVVGTGLMTPLEHTSRHVSVITEPRMDTEQRGAESHPTRAQSCTACTSRWLISTRLRTKNRQR